MLMFMADATFCVLFTQITTKQNHFKTLKNYIKLLKWLKCQLIKAVSKPEKKKVIRFFFKQQHNEVIINKIIEKTRKASNKEN